MESGHGPSMLRRQCQGLEDEEVERPLRQIQGGVTSCSPCGFDQKGALSVVEAQGEVQQGLCLFDARWASLTQSLGKSKDLRYS